MCGSTRGGVTSRPLEVDLLRRIGGFRPGPAGPDRPQSADPAAVDGDVGDVVRTQQSGVAQQQVHAAVFPSGGAITRSATC